MSNEELEVEWKLLPDADQDKYIDQAHYFMSNGYIEKMDAVVLGKKIFETELLLKNVYKIS